MDTDANPSFSAQFDGCASQLGAPGMGSAADVRAGGEFEEGLVECEALPDVNVEIDLLQRCPPGEFGTPLGASRLLRLTASAFDHSLGIGVDLDTESLHLGVGLEPNRKPLRLR